MKKSLVAALAVLSMSAFAGTSFSLIEGVQKSQNTGAVSHQSLVNLKTDLTESFAVDYLAILKSDQTNAITNRQEAGLSYSQKVVGPFSVYARGSLGLKQVSGSTSLPYYTVEPGATVALSDKVQAKVGYFYRDATQVGKSDMLRQTRYSVSYSLTAKDKVSVAYFHDLKSSDGKLSNAPYIGYTRSF